MGFIYLVSLRLILLGLSHLTPKPSPARTPLPNTGNFLRHAWRAKLKQRRLLASLGIFTASALWLAALSSSGTVCLGQPWYITLAIVAGFAIWNLTLNIPSPSVSQSPQKSCGDSFRDHASYSPINLTESCACTYFVFAVALNCLISWHLFKPLKQNKQIEQIIDIELTSFADATDNNRLLPSTLKESQLTVRRRRGAPNTTQSTQQFSKAAAKALPAIAVPSSYESKSNIMIRTREEAARSEPADGKSSRRPKQLVQPDITIASKTAKRSTISTIRQDKQFTQIPKSWTTQAIATTSFARTLATNTPSGDSQAFIEEVEPPELVELMENEGDYSSLHVFNNGGNTAGGTGAKNELLRYLKELHRRIKSAWSPPQGQSRKTQILFRIRKNGTLAFIKVTKPSADSTCDNAAIRAITSAASAHALPESFIYGYLDILYTFNYTADELKEIEAKHN